ncbi:hypothetical protein SLE2022_211230 [Rubroshorea leprosula]
MSLSPTPPLEPPLVDPNLPPPPPPPNIPTIIQIATGPSSIPQQPPVSHPSLTSNLPPKSFKDTLVQGSASIEPLLVTYEELVAVSLDLETPSPIAADGSSPPQPKVPKVRIPKSIWERLCASWTNAVIIKLLGKSVNFHALHSRLLKEWRLEHEFEIIDVGLGYYIVKFFSSQDCSMVLTGRPYQMFGHYLAVQPWELGFHPARAKAPKTAIWVKLHGVPIMCFYETICLYLGSKIGKPIKVDPATLLATRGKFARVCLEVDLSQPLPSSVDLDLESLPQSLIPIEFEGLHKICFSYGEFGHTEEHCRYKNPGQSPPVNNPCAKVMIELTQTLKPNFEDNHMVFGPWMVQQRQPKWQQSPRHLVEQATSDTSINPLEIRSNQNHISKTQAQPSTSKIVGNFNSLESKNNRFAMMVEIMEEDAELINSKEVNEPEMAGNSSKSKDFVGPTMPMDFAPTGPPPAFSTTFIKPKPNKRKTKTGAPVPKETKPLMPKPYQPPLILKKQQESSP